MITGIGAGSVLSRCYLDGASQDDAYCDLITRKADGSIETVRTTSLNSAMNKVEGIDFGAIYTMETEGMGSFRFSTDVTYYVTDSLRKPVIASLSSHLAGMTVPDWRWRANATVDWSLQRLGSDLEHPCTRFNEGRLLDFSVLHPRCTL